MYFLIIFSDDLIGFSNKENINMDIDDIIYSWITHVYSNQNVTKDNLHHFNITYELYMSILRIIQKRELSVEKTMPEVLRLINPQVQLPSPICNLSSKVKRFKGDKKSRIQDIIPQCEERYLGEYCETAGLKISNLWNNTASVSIKTEHITNGLIYELERYRCKEKLPTTTALKWTEQFFPKGTNHSTNVRPHSKAWETVYDRVT